MVLQVSLLKEILLRDLSLLLFYKYLEKESLETLMVIELFQNHLTPQAVHPQLQFSVLPYLVVTVHYKEDKLYMNLFCITELSV